MAAATCGQRRYAQLEALRADTVTLVSDAEVVTGGNAVILTIKTGAAGTTDVKYVDIDYSVI